MSVHFVLGLSNTWNSILSTNTKVKNLGNVINAILLMPQKWAFRFRISSITKKKYSGSTGSPMAKYDKTKFFRSFFLFPILVK